MKLDHVEEAGKLIVLILALFIGALIGSCSVWQDIKKDAIRSGRATYNQTNGNFQWKD